MRRYKRGIEVARRTSQQTLDEGGQRRPPLHCVSDGLRQEALGDVICQQ